MGSVQKITKTRSNERRGTRYARNEHNERQIGFAQNKTQVVRGHVEENESPVGELHMRSFFLFQHENVQPLANECTP
jgi:hypothetical protein